MTRTDLLQGYIQIWQTGLAPICGNISFFCKLWYLMFQAHAALDEIIENLHLGEFSKFTHM